MPKKISQSSVEDQSEHVQPPSVCQEDHSKVEMGARKKADLGQRNGETASSSPENGSVNGDVKRKSRRRRKRPSNPENLSESKAEKVKNEDEADKCIGHTTDMLMIGLKSECANVWFEHSLYERAESLYQCWLTTSPRGASNCSSQSSGKCLISPSTPAPSSSACRHSDHVACHHVVQAVWLNKSTFDQAEHRFLEELVQRSVPKSLDLHQPPNRPRASTTPDEGYQSLAPTPLTSLVQHATATPTAHQSVNGLPHIPVELLRDVWVDKPVYDRAEAAFYQNLFGNNSSKRSSCTSRNSNHPQSLVEEEEEQDDEEVVVEEKRVVVPGKAEVFHALLPIQEEEEPAEVPDGEERGCHFLHPDSERIWTDRWRYEAAESRFYHCGLDNTCLVKKNRRSEASLVSSVAPRDKKMSAVDFLAREKIWFDKPRYDEAERRFYEHTNGSSPRPQDVGANNILQDIARARENIQKSLAGPVQSSSGSADQGQLISRIRSLELENQSLHKVMDDLRAALSKLETRVSVLEKSPSAAVDASVPRTNGAAVQKKTSAPVKEEEEDDDDEIDLFGSDDDEEAEKLKEQRLKDYAEKKAKKPAVIAKSSILLDVKPWDDETDMAKLEECVRSVQADGLLWGASKLVPVGYGIKKLQIACVVEDEKVGTDLLEEEITKFEDYVQSVDVAAFNKI